MYVVDLIDRTTGQTVVEDYASFYSYEEAQQWADRQELEVRRCGWTCVVVQK